MIDSATSNPVAWIQHIFGSSAYLQMAGPEMFQQDEMHFMFLCHRTSAVWSSLAQHFQLLTRILGYGIYHLGASGLDSQSRVERCTL